MLKLIGTAAIFACLSIAPAMAANCRIARFEFVYGSDIPATMVTKSGLLCSGHINARSAMSSSSVTQPAAHGTASVDGHAFSYQSKPGYTGPDSFTVAMSGDSYRGHTGRMPISGTTNVSFAVQVVP